MDGSWVLQSYRMLVIMVGKKWLIGLIVLFFLSLSGTAAAAAGTPELWVFAPTAYGPHSPVGDATWKDVPYNEYMPLSIFCNIKEGSDLKITFSADAWGEIDIQVLVDGGTVMPDMVQFCRATSPTWSSYSFTFVKTGVTPGYHEVKVQMRANPSSPGVSSTIGARSLTVLAVPTGGMGYAAYDPGTTIDMVQTDQYVDVPGASCAVYTNDASNLEIAFSAESWIEYPLDHIIVRALVDNMPASPNGVSLAGSQRTESHSFTFTKTGLTKGWHTVKMQWCCVSLQPCYMASRSLTAFTSRPGDGLWMAASSSTSWITTTSPAWVDLSGLTTTIQVHEPTTLEAVVSGEATYVPDLRTLIDSAPLEPANTIFSNGPWKGATRFSFTKTVDPGIHTVRVQWHTWDGATASFGDRSLVVIAPQSPAKSLKGVYRPSAWNNWILDRSIDGITDFRDHYGSAGDKPLAGDLNNDDRVDRALFRSGEWIIDHHMDGLIDVRDHYGQAGDIPLIGDFNNGGMTDRAVFRNGEWIIDYAMDRTVDARDWYGMAGDIPLAGDLNNDGKMDRAVFRKGEWIIDYNMDRTVNSRSLYGMAGDIPVIADFNNDGITDRAVFRNGEWIIDHSIDNSVNSRQRYGMAGDIPLAWSLPNYGGSIL